MQQQIQAGIHTTNLKVKIDFTLPEFSATKISTWECHVDDSAKWRYYTILGRDTLTTLGLNIYFFKNAIEPGDKPLKWPTAPMIDLGTYK